MRLLHGVTLCEYSFATTGLLHRLPVVRDKAGTAEMPVRLGLFDRVAVGDNARHPVLCTVQENEGSTSNSTKTWFGPGSRTTGFLFRPPTQQ